MSEENTTIEEKKVVEQPKNAIETSQGNTEQPAGEESEKEINFRKFREERKVDRERFKTAEAEALKNKKEAEALKSAMDAILNKKPSNQPSQDSDYFNHEEEDDEKKRISIEVNRLLKEREAENDKERRAQESRDLPNRLNRSCDGFDSVCTTENIEYLEFHYPEVAQAFKYAPDGYEKWEGIYKAIKRFVPNADGKEKHKAVDNLNKPKSMSTGITKSGDSAPTHLDSNRKEDNWRRMSRVMKGG